MYLFSYRLYHQLFTFQELWPELQFNKTELRMNLSAVVQDCLFIVLYNSHQTQTFITLHDPAFPS